MSLYLFQLCGDIGETVFESLVKNGRIKTARANNSLIPVIKTNGKTLQVKSPEDLMGYYNALLNVIDKQDISGAHANAYAWCVQIMEGMNLNELISENFS